MDVDEVLALLGRVGARDQRAFRQVYESVSRRVFVFAMKRLRDPTVATEVVSETLYEVWKRPEAFKGDSRFSTWVLGIARHKIIDKLRGRGAEHDDIDDHADLADPDAAEGFEALAEREHNAGVARCIERLSDVQRECLHLVYYEEQSLADIGRVQGVPENTVKTRLFHARLNVKKCLQQLIAREGS
jgi:RNA polymerase sigma-70 factor, ECF subfamily